MKSGTSGTGRIQLTHVTTVPMSLTFLRGQASFMKGRGINVSAVSSGGEDLEKFGAELGLSVHAVEMPREISPGRDLFAVARTVRVLRRTRPQIVHAHTPKGGLIGMVAALLAGVPVRVYHMRGLPMMTATGVRRSLLRWTERVSCRLAHRVICVSHTLRDVALSERLVSPEKIKVLLGGSGNGVDAMGRFNPGLLGQQAGLIARQEHGLPRDSLVIGFVGRIVRDKGVIELVGAWKTLREEFPNLHLLMVGPFEPRDRVPEEIEGTLRSDPRVHLVGMDWDTPPLYAAMDVVALPTYREGFPNVPLEAAAMGIPVVATRIPGCVDAVQEGVTGTLVTPGDVESLANGIRAYLRSAELREQHGRAGRERVLREFRSESIWEAIYGEYAALLRERGLMPPRDGMAETLAASRNG